MKRQDLQRFAHLAMFALLLLFVLVLSGDARAAGTMRITAPEATERSGEWSVKVRIDLPNPPPLMHLPMRFVFLKQVVYERTILERGKEPVLNKISLANATRRVEQMDVDFADPSGKIFKSTNFEFPVRRSSGYFEAGEYQVQLTYGDGDVGTAQKLVLKGDNPTVYRGAMDFNDKIQKVPQHDAGAVAHNTASNDPASPAPTSTDVAPSGSSTDMIPTDAYEKTPDEQIRERPKGCGCVVAGNDEGRMGLFAIAAFALGGALVFRRRR